MIHHEIFESDAFRALKCASRCLLLELQRLYVPGSREDVFLSVPDAAKRIKVNKDTAARAFHDLRDKGFIVLTNHHLWQARTCRKFRITYQPYKNREPTDDWRLYKNPAPKVGDRLTQTKGQPALEDAAKP